MAARPSNWKKELPKGRLHNAESEGSVLHHACTYRHAFVQCRLREKPFKNLKRVLHGGGQQMQGIGEFEPKTRHGVAPIFQINRKGYFAYHYVVP